MRPVSRELDDGAIARHDLLEPGQTSFTSGWSRIGSSKNVLAALPSRVVGSPPARHPVLALEIAEHEQRARRERARVEAAVAVEHEASVGVVDRALRDDEALERVRERANSTKEEE